MVTRPTFYFDQHDFNDDYVRFSEVTTKNMQMYQDSNMKIDNFRLRMACYYSSHSSIRENHQILTNKLIVSALEMGATELDLDLHSSAFVLPREVLESEQLKKRKMLEASLNPSSYTMAIKLGYPKRRPKIIDLSGMNMFKLHKLRRLFLENVQFDPLFFSDFASRFPCLKDLSISYCCCRWSEAIQIASTSLESISFVKVKVKALTAEFDVPNLVSFRYSGKGIPSLCIESSREWESDVSIETVGDVETHSNSWYLRLKKLLTQLRPSNISLCISRRCFVGGVTDFKGGSTPLVVENLTIVPPYGPSGYTILSGLLSICRPKLLTWFTDDYNLCKRVMKEIITPNCEISDQNMFGQLGLKEASAEVLEERPGGWSSVAASPFV